MQLVLVRHGQSTNNALYAEATTAAPATRAAGPADRHAAVRAREWHYQGRVPDPQLSAVGVRQAQTLGEALLLPAGRAPFTPTHLYSSPTTRAVQTAGPLAEATGLPVVLHPDCYEVGGIHLFDPQTGTRQARPGATLHELREHYRDVEALPGIFDPPDHRWSGGLETRDDQALPRAERLLASLRETHGPDDVVLMVSHQYFSQFVLAAVFGWGGPPWRRFRVDNTGHLSLRLDDGHASVDWVNRVDHLHPADVTN